MNEVLVVNDGSSDGTSEIAQAAGALVIEHEKNKGTGAAVSKEYFFKEKEVIINR